MTQENPELSQPLATEDRRKEVRKVIMSSYVGTTIEYYDFLLYTSASALVFADVFFSDLSDELGTILSFTTLLAGYLARPLGGIIFGHYGDRLGRKKMLLITMAMMSIASFAIGLVPGYVSIGIWAPILLVLFRVFQGIAVGGDWGGSATISVEASEEGKRGLTAAFVNMGAPTGAVLGSVVLALFGLMNTESFLDWGWRIPFLIGGLAGIAGMVIRSRMSESPLFAEMQEKAEEAEKQEVPIVSVLKNHWRAVLLAAFGTVCCFALQGLLASYGLSLGTDAGHSRTMVLIAFGAGSALQVGGLAFYAHLSDRFGRRRVMMFGTILGAVLTYPIFWMIQNGSVLLLFAGMVIGMALVQAAVYGPSAAFISEMFDTKHRYTGASLGYQLASTLGGGASPVIAATLVAAVGGFTPVTIYVIALFVVGFFIIRLAKEGTQINLQNVGADTAHQQAEETGRS